MKCVCSISSFSAMCATEFSRRGLILAALGFLVTALPAPTKSSAQTTQDPQVEDAEEYAVYSVILNSLYPSAKPKQFVINGETSSKTKPAFVGFIAGFTPTGGKRPDVGSDVNSDFDAKNEKPYLIRRRLDVSTPYVLVTGDELHKIFGQADIGQLGMGGWPRFYQQYEGAEGIMAFSRVGFDSKRNLALVYVVVQRNLLGGRGMFIVLSKTEKSWQVKSQVVTWLS